MIEPIRLRFEVNPPPPHVVHVWTSPIGQWWPVDHTISAKDGLAVVLAGRQSSRIFEQTAAGVTHDWGEVTAREPPTRLTYRRHLPPYHVAAAAGR